MTKQKRIPQIITLQEFRRIIKYIILEQPIASDYFYGKYCKMKWILQLLMIYFMGLRPQEARLIQIKHIDFKKKRVFIPAANNKIRNDDYVPIPSVVYEPLWIFLKMRSSQFKDSPWLFASKGRQGHSDRNYLSKKFCKILKRLGISQESKLDKAGFVRMNKNLYSLRHSFGTAVYEATKDVRQTAIALRHKDHLCRCAMVYIHTSDDQTREDIFKKAFPEKKEKFI